MLQEILQNIYAQNHQERRENRKRKQFWRPFQKEHVVHTEGKQNNTQS